MFASNTCTTKIHTNTSHTDIQSSKDTLQFNFTQVAITIESAVQLITRNCNKENPKYYSIKAALLYLYVMIFYTNKLFLPFLKWQDPTLKH